MMEIKKEMYILASYIQRLELYNRVATYFTGFIGTWWLWLYGVFLITRISSFTLLFYALGTLAFTIFVVYTSAGKYLSFPIRLLRVVSLISIIFMYNYGLSTFLTICLFTITILFHDGVIILQRRVNRTQRYSNTLSNNRDFLSIIHEANEYVSDRLTWLTYTHIIAFLATMVFYAITYVFGLIPEILNYELVQIVSFIALLLLIFKFLPKLYPGIEKPDPYAVPK